MSGADLEDLARSVVARAAAGEEVEAYAIWQRETTVEAQDGEVEAVSSAESRGVGVRVVAGGRQGYASTAVVTDAALDEVLEAARANAAVASPDDANGLPEATDPPALDGLVDPGLATTPVEHKVARALELEAAARGADARIRAIDVARYGDRSARVALASTAGLVRTGERTDAWAVVRALAGGDGGTQAGFGMSFARGPDGLDVAAAGREAAGRALRLLGARKPRTHRAAIVFDPLVTAAFLSVLGGALSAEAVLKGRSVLAGRLGEHVAAPGTSLVDDGLRPGAPATFPWDGEGVPQQTTAVIADGVLRSYLHDTWTARRGGAASTGNAARASFRSSPGVRPTNLFLEPGGATPEQLLEQVGDGVYVQEVMGLHSGANAVSGEFSVSFVGLVIRGGELAEPVREAAVSSTLPEVLAGITAVASDLRFYPLGGALGGATVVAGEMTVSGT